MSSEVRQEAWMTYTELFDYIRCESETPLPEVWAADLL